MADTLLTTKFFIPVPRKGLVGRPRLLNALHKSLDRAVTILTAPPGFGKTTLLAAWISSLQETAADPPIGCAWLSLDSEDNTLPSFWTYAVTSLERVILQSPPASASDLMSEPPFSEIKDLLASSSPPFQVFLTILINQLSRVPQPLLLILDDYHTILDAAIADSLAFLVDHSPPNLHLVISSRTDPPLPVGRWRVRGQVNSLRAQDLRFTLDEAVELMNDSMGLSLSREDVEQLDQRTEGWAAGLQMAAFALQDQDGPGMTRSIAGFSGRHHVLLDYFTDEVLQRQPSRIQRFLLYTSVLDRMCADLCAAVMQGSQDSKGPSMTAAEAQAELEYLERANLFVVSLDAERRWYRYHHLFSDLLRARLREALGPVGEADLRRRAAAWHSQEGYLSEAVNQALLARDYDLAASLIESPAQSARIWESGDVAAILKWTQELPPEVTRKHLWLRLYQSRSLFYTGQADAAESILDEIEQEIRQPSVHVPQKAILLGMVLSHKARYASLHDRITTAREIARQALEALPPAEIAARSFVFPTLALSTFRMGDAEEAARLFEETAQTTRRLGSRFQTLGNMTNLAVTRLSQGKLNEVVRITRQAIQEGTIHGIRLPESGWLCYPLAEALYEQNHLVEAEQTLTEGQRLVEEGKLTNYFGQMPALLARIQFALGHVDEAQAAMEHALSAARRSTVAFYISEIEAHQARLWVQMDELKRALAWAEAYQGRPRAERLCEIEEITLGEVLLSAGQAEKARDVLLPLGEDARRRGRGGREIQIRLILGLCSQDLGDSPGAHTELERALLLGAPEGYVRPFLNLGEPLRLLLINRRSQEEKRRDERQDNFRGGVNEYADRLKSAFHRPGDRMAAGKTSRPSLPEPLTRRELEVLQLLSQGHSNQQIADHFVISLPTVKKHIGNIFGKLDVTSRTQAIARARELGLT